MTRQETHFNTSHSFQQSASTVAAFHFAETQKSVITLWSFCIISWCKNVSASASFLPPLRGVTTSTPPLPRRLWIPVTSVRRSGFCSVSVNWIQFRVEDLVLHSRPLQNGVALLVFLFRRSLDSDRRKRHVWNSSCCLTRNLDERSWQHVVLLLFHS